MTDPSHDRPGTLERPCLIVVDLQRGDADPASAYVERRTRELGQAARDYYVSRLRDVVVPNTRTLCDAFRERGWTVVFVRIQSLTADGRDRGAGHKERGIHFPPGSWDAEILPDLRPGENDILLSKTSGSAFVGTGLVDILDNLGARDLVVAGAVTGSCVLATVADARRVGRGTVVAVDDATATWSPAMQEEAESAIRDTGAIVLSTSEVLAALPHREAATASAAG